MTRAVLLAPALVCPVCGEPARHMDLRAGATGWGRCNTRGSQRDGSCPGYWFAVALPPKATGATLAALIGVREASALIRAALELCPGVPDDAIDALSLDVHRRETPDDDAPSYLIVGVHGRDRNHYRHRPVRVILCALGLLEAA